MNKDFEEKNERSGEAERPASYGGYVARQSYEKKNRRAWQTPALIALFLLLFLLSVVGLVTLFRGDLIPGGESSDAGAPDKVTVPVLNSKEISPEDAVAVAEEALITVELKTAAGVRRGSGFLVTADGYAVCHSSLFGEETVSVTVYTGDGVVSSAQTAGSIPSLGITILRLDKRYTYHSVALGSGTVRRGQTLYGVASVSRGVFYGLTLEGTASSTAETVMVSVGDEERSLPILYTSIPYDTTLEGALAVTENGSAVGFLTGTLPGRGGMTAVPIITLVGLVNEIINVE